MPGQHCAETRTIGHDPGTELTCALAVGHHGFHEDRTADEDAPVLWIPKHVGSTGYVSPRETWPDDAEIDEAIAEAETLNEAMFEIAEKFDVPLTNSLPRWQEGRFVRQAGDFLEDVYDAFDRFGPNARTHRHDAIDAISTAKDDQKENPR